MSGKNIFYRKYAGAKYSLDCIITLKSVLYAALNVKKTKNMVLLR